MHCNEGWLGQPWCSDFGYKAMEEFYNSAWRGQRTSEGREPFGREKKTTERAEPNFAPPQLEVFNGRK